MERELAEEIRAHLEMLTELKIREGLNPEAARRAASIELGGEEQVKERVREARLGAHLDALWQDLSYASRMLRRAPGFTLIAVMTLALGIGANTAIFCIVKSVLIRPLPFVEPDRLMQASYRPGPGAQPGAWLDWIDRRDLVDWCARSRSFERIGGYWNAGLTLPGEAAPEFIGGVSVTPELLPALGIQPVLGRLFLPEEARPGGDRPIILSDDLWRQRFGADPEILGRTIRAVDRLYVVVGVMPSGFDFPLKQRADLRMPSRRTGFWTLSDDDLSREPGDSRLYHAILRLKPGVRPERAQVELETIFAQRAHDDPQSNHSAAIGVRLVSLKDHSVGQAGLTLSILLGAVTLVVLMVCANLAGLLSVRAVARRREMAIRQAIGASRPRLVRQVLTESLLLALAGGAAGIALAAWSLKLLLKLSPHYIPRLGDSQLDAGTLAFALGVTVTVGLLYGALPAWLGTRVDLNATLKQTAGRASAWRRSLLAPGNLLVTFEVALALVLTVGTGLLLNSFVRLMTVDLGIHPGGVTAALVGPAPVTFFRQVIERLEQIPGIEAAGSSNGLPLTQGGNVAHLKIEGRPPAAGQDPTVLATTHVVSSGYLRTLGVPLLRGRQLAAPDTAATVPVAVINETAAQRFWPGADPLGKRLSFGRPDGPEVWRQVVGVVKSTRHFGIEKEPQPEVYVPVEQEPWPVGLLFVRSSLPPAEIAGAIRRTVAEVDRNRAVPLIIPMKDVLSDAVSMPRFSLLVLGGFSALALMLAVMGVYGVVSDTIAQRTPEIGLRIALGAQGRDILRTILGQGMRPVVVGLVIGLAAARALGRVLSGLLYGVTAADAATFAVVLSLLSLVAGLACYLPARRATKVDPMIILRHE